jgi:hypothetical protein
MKIYNSTLSKKFTITLLKIKNNYEKVFYLLFIIADVK